MEKMNHRHQIIMKYPASWWKNMWREALPSGNGVIGASVYGAVEEETIILGHAELWHWGRKDELPDVSHTLAETRKLMDEHQFLKASWHLTNAVRESGYNTKLAARFPVAEIKLQMPCKEAFRAYQRSLNMETGEVSVKWNEGSAKYERKLFVSRSDDVIVYEIASDQHLVSGTIGLAFHPTDGGKSDQYIELEQSIEVKAEQPYVYYAGKNDDGTDFGAVMRVIPTGGQLTQTENAVRFTDCEKVLVLVKVFVTSGRNESWAKLKQELSMMNESYDRMLASHQTIHQRLFHSASMALGDEKEADWRSNEELMLEAYGGEAPTSLIEKMWAYGRYLFISGTDAQSLPFGMYGLWGGDYRLIWSHNMANENVQMMYWHAPVGGLHELMPALFNYYEQMMDDFRSNAKKLYGCRGIYIPAGTTPGIGVPNQIVPVIMNWTSAAGWLSRHYYEYYLFTGDEQFLKEKLLPFMRETALFYEDFLVVGEDGCYRYYPSVSPENTPQNFMPKDGKEMAHPMPTAMNATMDFAILKELLTHLIEAAETVGEDKEEIEKWKTMLSRIPPYQVNEDSAVKEWMHPLFEDRYDHRHLSHIYPVFPGQEFTREEEPELFQAFETAVKLRVIGAQSGWSLAHMASIYARLGNGNRALECLNLLARSCLLNNFFTLHNDWRNMGICLKMQSAPVQMDANMGWVNAVQEMLLYVSPKLIKFLPALPDKWDQGSVRDFRFPTGRVSFQWNRSQSLFEAELVAERDTAVTIKLPEFIDQWEWQGEHVSIEPSELGDRCYVIRMNKGQTLTIRS